jgi:hypothetical protein
MGDIYYTENPIIVKKITELNEKALVYLARKAKVNI